MTDKTISQQTEETVLELKGKFGPKGFINNLMGRNKKTAEKEFTFTGSANTVKEDVKTATKIKPLEQGNMMVEALMKIYEFMRSTSEEKKLHSELVANLNEANKLAADKRHKELIEALKNLKGGKEDVTAEKVVDEAGGIFGVLGDILNAFGGAKTALSLLSNVGRFFLFNPIGIGLVGGATLLTLLARDEKPEETTKGILTAADAGAQAQSIMDVVENTSAVERRRMNLLADRPSSKKSYLFWKDPELQQKYLDEIGWDNATGTTKEERDKGFIKLDENGKLIKAPPNAETSATPMPSPSAPSAPPATEEDYAKLSGKLNDVTKENNDLKLPTPTNEAVPTVNNMVASNVGQKSEAVQRNIIPAVRNLEDTFQRMIYYSTRVV